MSSTRAEPLQMEPLRMKPAQTERTKREQAEKNFSIGVKKTCFLFFQGVNVSALRGYSSDGRAIGSQSIGQGFDPPYLHQLSERACRLCRSFNFIKIKFVLLRFAFWADGEDLTGGEDQAGGENLTGRENQAGGENLAGGGKFAGGGDLTDALFQRGGGKFGLIREKVLPERK